jgi:hypothetical protein
MSMQSVRPASAPPGVYAQDAGSFAQPARDGSPNAPRDTRPRRDRAERVDPLGTASLYRAASANLPLVSELIGGSARAAVAPLVSAHDDAIAQLLEPLRAVTRPGAPLGSQPVPQLAQALDALFRYAAHADDSDKAALRAALADMLAGARHHPGKDLDLLTTVIEGAMAGRDPSEVLGGIAELSLNLPDFNIRPDDQPEPPERHFTSTLLPFAAAAYDYGPLGRTLLLEGARACFAGASQARRGEKLQEVMFALPYPTASGELLESMADIFMALRERGIDV